jgi:hypothetical protein
MGNGIARKLLYAFSVVTYFCFSQSDEILRERRRRVVKSEVCARDGPQSLPVDGWLPNQPRSVR